ncbi:MAG: hypothetical protein IIA61_00515 [Candidatus Marinimicrobia bacterium]|nr:hypothetical protein [Candidatus Neomarinimicrobiota bacterium]
MGKNYTIVEDLSLKNNPLIYGASNPYDIIGNSQNRETELKGKKGTKFDPVRADCAVSWVFFILFSFGELV